MACKTLIVGIKPDTFDLLFPSDAMIALAPDGSDFDEKIDYLLSNPTVYMDLIESNYRNLMAKQRWTNGSVEKVGVRAPAAPVSDIRNQLIS